MTLHIHQAALMMTVQDAGRTGYQRFGMPESGPMDGWAFRAANRLVGNAPGAACVEVGFSNAEFALEGNALLAVCGAGYRLWVNRRAIPLWMSFLGKNGDVIRLEKSGGGNWAYLAAAGGVQSEVWMGSRSAYPAAGLGRRLAEGDRLPLQPPSSDAFLLAGRSLPARLRPPYTSRPLIRVVPGPHAGRFQPVSWETFLAGSYAVSPQSDRMGYRLNGPSLAHQRGADLVSQGMVLGEIQVPGDGQPIVMMPDHPTTGGYACIAVVARADLPLLTQVEPGRGALRFTPLSVADAQAAWQQALVGLDSKALFQEDTWTGI
jgi:antagonist of KipI